ncbi:MAG: S8 family serine peptidase [Lachnospiraceae bacterium]|nr:S8 family serine peptidase [Lachnospiraceae bacterium]
MKKKLLRVLSMLLSFIVFASSINISLPVKAEGTTPSVYINPSNTQAVYTYDGYYVVFNLNGSWPGGHNVGIQIYNTGTETIEDWTLESDYSNNISNIWNASVIENGNGVTKLYHDTWNSVVYPNSCVEFGFSSNESFVSFPTYFGILGSEIIETNNEMYSIDYTITDEWEDGYTGLVTITNNSENVIRNWALDFSCNNENISVWNAELISKDGNRISVGNMGFNANINSGESVTFGFIVYNKTNNDEFYDYSLSESTVVSNEPPRELEPLGDIGVAYCKELRDEDVVFDEATGLQYVKNQILISAYMGTPREAIEDIVAEVGATIVGYIEMTCDYQIEFSDNKTLIELQTIVDYINGFSFVSLASLNLASEEEINYYTNDSFYHDKDTCKYVNTTLPDGTIIEYATLSSNMNNNIDTEDENIPQGDNWGLEALCIPTAWDYVTNTTTVKVGIYDNYFENRTDNKNELIFDDIIGNPHFDSNDYNLSHGDHVAGIIGAIHNNETGISGVATDVKLYGYSYKNNSLYSNSMYRKVAYAKLICNQVRVINVSLGYKDEGMIYAASLNDGSNESKRAQNYIDEDARIIEEHLIKLKNAGYDFLIVGAAGNSNNCSYLKTNGKYGYTKSNENNSPVSNIDAKYGYYLGVIKNESLKRRIIIVGSVGVNDGGSFYCASYTSSGDRIDVFAPGENILSTVPVGLDYPSSAINGYNVLSGTSMAAPHISGLAALMLQVNPSLNGAQLKNIICDDSNMRISLQDNLNVIHNIPHGRKCVQQALNTVGIPNEISFPTGYISGTVSSGLSVVQDADIYAIRKDSGEYNIELEYYNYIFGSDDNGEFQGVLPQGTYDIIVSADGYLPTVVENVEIRPNETKTIPINLLLYNGLFIGSKISGKVIDAITGNAIENANIKVRSCWNKQTGTYVKNILGEDINASTSYTGEFEMSVPLGNYTVEIEKEGYIIGYFNVVSFVAADSYINTFALSPVLPDNEYRIILTWSDTPRDLDSHLCYYMDGNRVFHVYWAYQTGCVNETEVATLDLDDVDGFGPETVTITVDTSLIQDGRFEYYVHNYSQEKNISESNACVKVYNGNAQIDVVYVPKDLTGTDWYVFDITPTGIVFR